MILMPGPAFAIMVIPIVVALSLFVWIALMTRADRHPGEHRGDPRTDLPERARRGRDDSVG